MGQKQSLSGRPLEFDPDRVLEKAMLLFWEKGFEEASMGDLEKRTGLNRPSLYNFFGSKKDIFQSALQLYHEQMTRAADACLRRGNGFSDLSEFFDFIENHVRSPMGKSGCLMVNSMIDFGEREPSVHAMTTSYRNTMKSALEFALRKAFDRRVIPNLELESKAELLIAILLGINVSARAGLPAEQLKIMIDSARKQIEDWKGANL